MPVIILRYDYTTLLSIPYRRLIHSFFLSHCQNNNKSNISIHLLKPTVTTMLSTKCLADNIHKSDYVSRLESSHPYRY